MQYMQKKKFDWKPLLLRKQLFKIKLFINVNLLGSYNCSFSGSAILHLCC